MEKCRLENSWGLSGRDCLRARGLSLIQTLVAQPSLPPWEMAHHLPFNHPVYHMTLTGVVSTSHIGLSSLLIPAVALQGMDGCDHRIPQSGHKGNPTEHTETLCPDITWGVRQVLAFLGLHTDQVACGNSLQGSGRLRMLKMTIGSVSGKGQKP